MAKREKPSSIGYVAVSKVVQADALRFPVFGFSEYFILKEMFCIGEYPVMLIKLYCLHCLMPFIFLL